MSYKPEGYTSVAPCFLVRDAEWTLVFAHKICAYVMLNLFPAAGLLPMNAPSRKPTNLSISSSLLAEARKLKINLSRAAETGLSQAVLEAKAKKWKEDNAAALESSNSYVDKHGLPLEEYRQF